MKNKALYQLGISLALFFGTWFLLSQINYTRHIDFARIGRENERKLSDLVFESIKKTNHEIDQDSVKTLIHKIKERICQSNGIDSEHIHVHVIHSSDINAFALPDNRIVVYSGLIDFCISPEELAGVIAHEIAHIEHGHVMQKLTKEIGLSMLITLAGGNSGSEILKETVRLISSTAFDRKQEKQADASAVHYMATAGMDPEHFANVLFRFSLELPKMPTGLEWVSSHPDSKERSAEVLKLREDEEFAVSGILDEDEWKSLQALLREN